jgi:DNA-binding transcriptional ArsR family regulator
VEAAQDLDRVFRALGDETRRALLARLAVGPEKVTDLAKPFAMSLPAVSRHIRVLEDAGLVSRKIDGRVHECSLIPGALAPAESWLQRYRLFWQRNLDALADYVEGPARRTRPARRRR